MSIVSLIIAPHIAVTGGGMDSDCCGAGMTKEYKMEKSCCDMDSGTMMGMDCEMDADGNCLIDSATCAAMMADGKIDSADCVRMENGKCAISSSACMKSMHGGKMMKCSAECMEACKAKGIDCSDPKACPSMKKDCCKK